MTKYWLEIKNRLKILCFALIFTTFIGYLYKEIVLFIIIEPNNFKSLTFFYFIFTNVTEIFTAYLKLITIFSFQILFFYTILHIFMFLSPAFSKFEYFYIKFIIKIIILSWLFTIIVAINILIPIIFSFFLSFQNFSINYSFNLFFEAKINEYLSFYLSFYYLCSFYCQCFILFLLVLNLTVVNFKKIREFRKFFYYCFIIFATLISQADIFIQISIILISIIGYEIFIINFLLRINFVK